MNYDFDKIVEYIHEINQLSKQKNTGFGLFGVDNPPSVSDHLCRAAQIGYILGKMEGVDYSKVVLLVLFHDNGKSRIGDQNKVAARYIFKNEAEELVIDKQTEKLGYLIGYDIKKFYEEMNARKTKEGIVAKDADWLEQAFQAKEYLDLGYEGATEWIKNVEEALETDSAKKILLQMKNKKFTDWWQGLMKMTYKKLK